MLTIGDLEFAVSSANFGAIVSLDEDLGWRFQWYFEFRAHKREFEGTWWHPKVFAEALYLSLPSPDALPGTSLLVPEPYNEVGDPNFLIYVFEHESACDIQIAFGEWHKNQIHLTLQGKGDVNWDDKYGQAVPIGFEGLVEFEGINVWHSQEELARTTLAQFYDPNKFTSQRSRIGYTFLLVKSAQA